MTHVADTSVLVASFDTKDSRRAEALRRMSEASPLIIPTEVLVEFLGVMKAKSGSGAAAAAFKTFTRVRNVLWAECCDFAAAHRIYEEEPALSFTDAVVVQQTLDRGMAPLTFDNDLQKAFSRRAPKGRP